MLGMVFFFGYNRREIKYVDAIQEANIVEKKHQTEHTNNELFNSPVHIMIMKPRRAFDPIHTHVAVLPRGRGSRHHSPFKSLCNNNRNGNNPNKKQMACEQFRFDYVWFGLFFFFFFFSSRSHCKISLRLNHGVKLRL